ncbi:MAG: dTDP-4-dehydrorhamnose reductase [Alphaproteobacteria bacterium]|nr:dTDP-4-dehydrorhamnose reductase [Alphaproteobacteria bacterium]
MRVCLVFGGGGQVGRELARAIPPDGWRVEALDRATADITDAAALSAILDRLQPAAAINAAAYTGVDKAESEPERAYAINAVGAGHVAAAAAKHKVPLVHLSTDFVFHDAKGGALAEDAAVDPRGYYASSKLAGEVEVRRRGASHAIVRTSWVFGVFGGNFVKTVLRLAHERPELGVVDDQRGAPTPAADIARTALAIARRLAGPDVGSEHFGTFHYCGAPATTWHGFAEAILAAAATHGHPCPPVRINNEYRTTATRPVDSTLDCGKLARLYGIAQPDWRQGLASVLGELLAGGRGP